MVNGIPCHIVPIINAAQSLLNLVFSANLLLNFDVSNKLASFTVFICLLSQSPQLSTAGSLPSYTILPH